MAHDMKKKVGIFYVLYVCRLRDSPSHGLVSASKAFHLPFHKIVCHSKAILIILRFRGFTV